MYEQQLIPLNDHIVAVERALAKETSSLESLQFQEQGQASSIKHLEEVIKTHKKAIEEAIEQQKNYEQEHAYNKATLMKLYQRFDEKTFKKIRDGINDTKVDPTLKETAALLVGLLNLKPVGTDAEIKAAFTDYKTLISMMQAEKLQALSSVDEKEYLKVQEGLSSRLAQYGNEKKAQERKALCNLMLRYIVFTIGVSMAKRNLSRASGRLEKMERDYIDKQAEYAKKVIHVVDPEQLKLAGKTVTGYKEALAIV